MNKKGFAISTVLYALAIIFIAIMFLFLSLLQFRYKIGSNLREDIEGDLGRTLAERLEKIYGFEHTSTNGACNSIEINSVSVTKGYDYTKIKAKKNNNANVINYNYIKYKGMKWRILSLDCGGYVTIVYDSSDYDNNLKMTYSGSNYELSNIHEFLNTTFLNTKLGGNYSNFIKVIDWNYDSLNIKAPVGILTLRDYQTTGSFITGESWYILDNSTMKVVSTSGNNDYDGTSSYLVRPVVVLLPNLVIKGGTGTSSDPFTLKNDE